VKAGVNKLFYYFFIFFVLHALLYSYTRIDKAESHERKLISRLPLSGLKVRSIGPALTSGRISDFAVNPHKRSEFYVATASGGVWKTTNAGTTMKPIFDNQGSYSIGCISLDPDNPHVVWVGCGENNNHRSVGYGDGVYKSIDGGSSWRNMGLKTSEHIGMIAIDSRDSDIVYVAAYGPLWSSGGERGLYKTVDGGKSWKSILTISEHTGISEVHLDPRNPDVVYAVAHQRRRHIWTYVGGGPESAIYKSEDGGASWIKVNNGLPEGDLGRIGLAISPVDPDVIYSVVEAQGDKGGFYRSRDRGASWERRSNYTAIGLYYQEIFCDPEDVDRIYAMDTRLQISDDGGGTFKPLGSRCKHIDNHALWIDPSDIEYLLLGTDGGVYESFDRGETWKFMSNLPVTQFYKIAVDNDFPFYNVYGGTQDNDTLGAPSRTVSTHGIVSADWFVTLGGDGFGPSVDPKDSDTIYCQAQYGNLVRFDRKNGEYIYIKPREGKMDPAYRWNWDAPFLISPHSHTRLYFGANKVFKSEDRGNSWEVISGDLSRQIDRNKLKVMGRIWPMDAVAKNESTSRYGNITTIDESPLKEGLLIAGTDDGLIHMSEDGGINWRRHSQFPGIPEKTYVSELLASQHDEETVYAAFNNHKNGDFNPYILKSTDTGRTWSMIVSNLPKRGSVYSLAEDHVNENLLFAGTEFGLFFTVDGGNEWIQLKNGLPINPIRDIAIQKRENDLILASFGRGIYVLDDYSPLRKLKTIFSQKEAYLFPIRDSLLYVENIPLGPHGSKRKGHQGDDYFSADNPPFGAFITYYLKEEKDTPEENRDRIDNKSPEKTDDVLIPSHEQIKNDRALEPPHLIFLIVDEDNNMVRELRSVALPGIHRIAWDLRSPAIDLTSLKDADPTLSGPSSTFVVPGVYKIFMQKNENGVITTLTDPVSFKVKLLKNSSHAVDDFRSLIEFQKKVHELRAAVDSSSTLVINLARRLKHYKIALKNVTVDKRELVSGVKTLDRKIRKIQDSLIGDPTLRRMDKNSIPALKARIHGIEAELSRSTSLPTQTHKKIYVLVSDEFSTKLKELRKIVEVEIPELEKKIGIIGAPYTPGRLPEWERN